MSQPRLPGTDHRAVSDDEEVLGNVEYSYWGWLRWIIIGVLTSWMMGLGLVILFLVYRAKKKSGCTVTNYRVIHTRAGLLSAETREIRMEDIRSISTYSSLGSGGVKLDTGGDNIKIGVTNPSELVNVIRTQIDKRAEA